MAKKCPYTDFTMASSYTHRGLILLLHINLLLLFCSFSLGVRWCPIFSLVIKEISTISPSLITPHSTIGRKEMVQEMESHPSLFHNCCRKTLVKRTVHVNETQTGTRGANWHLMGNKCSQTSDLNLAACQMNRLLEMTYWHSTSSSCRNYRQVIGEGRKIMVKQCSFTYLFNFNAVQIVAC